MHLPGTFSHGLLPSEPGPVPTLQLYSRISPLGQCLPANAASVCRPNQDYSN